LAGGGEKTVEGGKHTPPLIEDPVYRENKSLISGLRTFSMYTYTYTVCMYMYILYKI